MSSGPATAREGRTSVALDSPVGRRVLLATVLGSGMAFLDSTVVNVALPAIGADLGATVAGLQWILNGSLITLSALILPGGSLADRYGRRRVFQVGVVWFALASLICAMSASVPMLVAARMLQGIGGALLTPGSLAIVETSFAPADRGRAIGAWAGLTGIAAAVGPLVGGGLVDAGSWRSIFLVNAPLGAAAATLAARVPESASPEAETQRRSRRPMLLLSLRSPRQFAGANLVTAAVYAARGAAFFLLLVYLQQALGYSALSAGAAVLPMTILMLALSARSGELAQRIGPRLQLAGGPIIVACGIVLMIRIAPGADYATGVLPAVVVLGLGMALTVAPLTATVLAAAGEEHAGVASGINIAVARAAQLAAVAVVPVVAGLTACAAAEPAAHAAGFRAAMLTTAALAAAGGVLGWLIIHNRTFTRTPARPTGREPPE